MTPPAQEQEYTPEAIDDRLFRIERLAYECILNHPDSRGFCTEIKHISSELREAIRSRPAPSPITADEVGDICDQVAEVAAAKAREKVLDKLREWSIIQYEISGVIDTMTLKQKIESLRTEAEGEEELR